MTGSYSATKNLCMTYSIDYFYNRFVATLASNDLVDKGSIRVFKFNEYFHLNETEVCMISPQLSTICNFVICDWACENRLCECKLYIMNFSILKGVAICIV